MEIKDKMSAISDSLKPFTSTDYSLIISITRSHSFISSKLKTDNLPNFHFCHNSISDTFHLAHICLIFGPSVHLQSPIIIVFQYYQLATKISRNRNGLVKL